MGKPSLSSLAGHILDDRYKLIEQVGKGSHAVVYKALQMSAIDTEFELRPRRGPCQLWTSERIGSMPGSLLG